MEDKNEKYNTKKPKAKAASVALGAAVALSLGTGAVAYATSIAIDPVPPAWEPSNTNTNNVNETELPGPIDPGPGCYEPVGVKVSFDPQEHGTLVKSESEVGRVYWEGDKLYAPQVEAEEGWELVGWYTEPECVNEWDFENDTLKDDTTLYAKWVETSSKVEDPDDSIKVPEIPDEPVIPTEPETPITPVEPDVPTVDPTPGMDDVPVVCNVSFNFQGHGGIKQSDTPQVTRIYWVGDRVEDPEIEIPEGWYFQGWYKEADCTNKWDFENDKLTGDTTLYAKWVQASESEPMVVINKTRTDETANTGFIKINGASISNGEAVSVPESGDLEVSWTPAKSDSTTLSLVKSVKVNGNEQVASNVDKSGWTELNTELARRTGNSSARMVTMDKILAATQKFNVSAASVTSTSSVNAADAKLADANEVKSVDVEFQDVTPVYRLYNMVTSEHLFTTNKDEYDYWMEQSKQDNDFWLCEGIDWLAPKNYNSSTTEKVYRLYNAGLGALQRVSHYYTPDVDEVNALVADYGWVVETDTAFLSDISSLAEPIYTCYNENLSSAHHYTSSKGEWEALVNHGWDLERSKNGNSGFFGAAMSATVN